MQNWGSGNDLKWSCQKSYKDIMAAIVGITPVCHVFSCFVCFFLQENDEETRGPKASTIRLSCEDISEVAVQLVKGNLLSEVEAVSRDSEDTRDVLCADIVLQSGKLIKFYVALGKALKGNVLSDIHLLNASQILDACVEKMEEFAQIWDWLTD